jgi:uncharacterized membrane protein YbhN (UPF0104 family)
VLRWTVALVAVGLLVRYIGAAEVLAALRTMHPAALAAYAAAFTAVPFLYGLQVHGALARLGHRLPRAGVVRATVQAWGVGTLTPARAGDLTLAAFLDDETARVDATAVVLVDKVVSLLVLAILAIASSVLVRVPYGTAFVIGISWVIGASLSLLSLVALPMADAPVSALARRVLGLRAADTWARVRVIVRSRQVLLWSAALATLRWVYVCVAGLLLFWGAGAHPGLGVVIAATAVGRIVSILPVSIGGLGVKEPLQIVMYAGVGVPAETVLVVSILGMGCGFVAAAVAPAIAGAVVRGAARGR